MNASPPEFLPKPLRHNSGRSRRFATALKRKSWPTQTAFGETERSNDADRVLDLAAEAERAAGLNLQAALQARLELGDAAHTEATSDDAALEILVVEDSVLQAKVLKELLSLHGFQVSLAFDGEQGLQMARESRPSLILCDVVMPLMGGYEMCNHLKNDAQLRDVPVILLTALSDLQDVVSGLECRADLYLTKPYSADYLLQMVRDTLRHPPQNEIEYSNQAPLDFFYGGKKHTIHADRRQILNLLLSTYGNAVEQNRALAQAQNDLRDSNDQLHERTREVMEQQKELEQANVYLKIIASHDGLTGLKNHTSFKTRLSEEVKSATQSDQPLSLLLIDVDFFKQFNDTFGHPAGDEVLRAVARLLKQECRAQDFVARYGGEEFAVLLPNASRQLAGVLAERLRRTVENCNWPLRAITVSVGVATFNGTQSTPDTEFALLEAADRALYASKHSGRNCATHSSELLS